MIEEIVLEVVSERLNSDSLNIHFSFNRDVEYQIEREAITAISTVLGCFTRGGGGFKTHFSFSRGEIHIQTLEFYNSQYPLVLDPSLIPQTKILKLGCGCIIGRGRLSEGIEEIHFTEKRMDGCVLYQYRNSFLPESVRKIVFISVSNILPEFQEGIQEIILSDEFKGFVGHKTFPTTLKKLYLGENFSQKILPGFLKEGLEELILGEEYITPPPKKSLPPTLCEITFGEEKIIFSHNEKHTSILEKPYSLFSRDGMIQIGYDLEKMYWKLDKTTIFPQIKVEGEEGEVVLHLKFKIEAE